MSCGQAGPLCTRAATRVREDDTPPELKRHRANQPRRPGYLAKSFSRTILGSMERKGGPTWDVAPLSAMPFSTVLRWSPDETEQCLSLRELLAVDVLRKFGLSPLWWVRCWACFGCGLDEADLAALLRTPDRDLFWVVSQWERNMVEAPVGVVDQFSPTVVDFLEAAKHPQVLKRGVKGDS